MNYTARQNQSIYDICLQTYGTLDLLIKLCQDNGIEGIEDTFAIGKVFIFDDTLIFSRKVFNDNQNQQVYYSTSSGGNNFLVDSADGSFIISNGEKIIT